jgi:hypothetical protein
MIEISLVAILFISGTAISVAMTIGLYCRLVGQQDFIDANVNQEFIDANDNQEHINGLPTVSAPFL